MFGACIPLYGRISKEQEETKNRMGIGASASRNKVHNNNTATIDEKNNSNNNKLTLQEEIEKEKSDYSAVNFSSISSRYNVTPVMKNSINNLIPLYQTIISSQFKTQFLVSIIPKRDGENLLITITDGSTHLFFSNRTPNHIVTDMKLVMQIPKEEPVECEEKMWQLFLDSLTDSVQQNRMRIIPNNKTNQSTMHNNIDARLFIDMDEILSLHTLEIGSVVSIDIPLRKLKHTESVNSALPDTIFSLFNTYDKHLQQIQSTPSLTLSPPTRATSAEVPLSSNGSNMDIAELENVRKDLEEKNEKIQLLERKILEIERPKSSRAVFSAFAQKTSNSKNLAFAADSEDGDPVSFEVPVQKVLDILSEWKSAVQSTMEKNKLDFIMSTIANDALYEVDVDAIASKESDIEVKSWIQSELGSSSKKNKKWNTVRAYTRVIYFARALSARDHTYSKPDLNIPANIAEVLANIGSYDFDVFKLDKVTGHRPLYYMALRLFEIHDLFVKFQLPVHKVREFLFRIEEGYTTTPYHNRVHACDVLQTINYLLMHIHCKDSFSNLDILTMLVTAIMHDYQHPGVNNNYEMRTQSDRALLYNDQAILENFHCTSFFRLIKEDKCNFLEVLNDQDFKQFRDSLIHMVLGTDMGQHFIILGTIRTSIVKEFHPEKREDIHTLMRLMLKCADVSNPSKILPLYTEWADRVVSEFFIQGDKEREMQLPLSAFMDREKPNLPKCQVAFIDYICRPLFECLIGFAPEFHTILENVLSNREHYSIILQQQEQ
jgi:hypothetical protein